MTYTPTTWIDETDPDWDPGTSPKIDADNLNHIEEGIADVDTGLATANSDITTLSGSVDAVSADVDALTTRLDYITIGGANLAAASTLTPTADFHIVTGTTAYIATLNVSSPAVGQQIRLQFQSAQVLSNSLGTIRTVAGVDRHITPSEIVTFTYDGAHWWDGKLPPGVYTIFDVVVGRGNAGDPTAPAALIDSNTILGGSIPQFGKHLRLTVTARNDRAVGLDDLWLRFNNDSAANYGYQFFGASGASFSGGESGGSPGTAGYAGLGTVGGSGGTGRFGTTTIDVPDYTSTNRRASLFASASIYQAATGGGYARSGALYWDGAAAVTRIQIYPSIPGSGNFVSGSSWMLQVVVK